jgi:hypothetical protein
MSIASSSMEPGAKTPEELEALFEDAFVTRDGAALAGLFEDGAVLVDGVGEARGLRAIASFTESMWGRTYLADATRVLQARDTALLVAEQALSVARRGEDGSWRFAISFLAFSETEQEE